MLKALIDLFKINRQEKQTVVIEPVITEPITIQDEIKIEKDTPKRGRPKTSSKLKSNKKK